MDRIQGNAMADILYSKKNHCSIDPKIWVLVFKYAKVIFLAQLEFGAFLINCLDGYPQHLLENCVCHALAFLKCPTQACNVFKATFAYFEFLMHIFNV